MRIAKVELTNFQAYENVTFDFTEGLNVIKGISSVGKSSIVRAIDHALYCGRCPDDYKRKGTKTFTVAITLSDGTVVVREKGTGVNKYTLVKDDKEELFENFGSDVPIPIKKALKVEKLVYDKDKDLKLHVANQFDPLFLFTETGSVKSKILGILSKIHLVDVCLRSLNTEMRGIDDKSRTYNEIISRCKEEEPQYANLPEQKKFLKNADKLFKNIEESQVKQQKLNDLDNSRFNLNNSKKRLENSEANLQTIDISTVEKMFDKYQKLCNAYTKYTDTTKSLKSLTETSNKLKNISPETCEQLLIDYQSLRDRCRQWQEASKAQSDLEKKDAQLKKVDLKKYEEALEKYQRLSALQLKGREISKRYSQTEEESDATEQRFKDSLARYEQLLTEAGMCPLCGGEISKEGIAKHLEELR